MTPPSAPLSSTKPSTLPCIEEMTAPAIALMMSDGRRGDFFKNGMRFVSVGPTSTEILLISGMKAKTESTISSGFKSSKSHAELKIVFCKDASRPIVFKKAKSAGIIAKLKIPTAIPHKMLRPVKNEFHGRFLKRLSV